MALDEKSLAKIQNALRQIEQAQNLLEGAACSLSPVEGFAADWTKVGKLRDQAKALWFSLESHYLVKSRRVPKADRSAPACPSCGTTGPCECM